MLKITIQFQNIIDSMNANKSLSQDVVVFLIFLSLVCRHVFHMFLANIAVTNNSSEISNHILCYIHFW